MNSDLFRSKSSSVVNLVCIFKHVLEQSYRIYLYSLIEFMINRIVHSVVFEFPRPVLCSHSSLQLHSHFAGCKGIVASVYNVEVRERS